MAVNNSRVLELEGVVSNNPGADEFVELATLLAEIPEKRSYAREICFKGVNSNPSSLRGRLILARLFYLDGMLEFAARELAEVSKFATVPSLTKLMDNFGAHIKPYRPVEISIENPSKQEDEGEVLAEIDLDSAFAEALKSIGEDPDSE
jgi:hypothetical protein